MSAHSRRTFLRRGLQATPLAALSGRLAPLRAKKKKSPELNLLFIAVDDLRPELGCYGNRTIHTPHIDSIAERGLTFLRAYCQQATSSPSRTSLLTGRRPDTTEIYNATTHFRRYLPNVVTLPQRFRQQGYLTTAFSKIYHKPQLDDPRSWSVPPWIPDGFAWGSDENRTFAQRRWDRLREAGWISKEAYYYEPSKRQVPAEGAAGWEMRSWESPDLPDEALPDGRTAEQAIRALHQIRAKPFFLAVGFLKPHLPFVAPKKYYDLYPAGTTRTAKNVFPPAYAPPFALHDSAELRAYTDIPMSGGVPPYKARELVRGYYASVSYVDAQIGRLLGALDDLGLRERTVIVLWGDHGYHLGDHGLWNKYTNFETATRTPLIVSAPDRRGAGRKTEALTELVDVYPSLCDICGLERPDGLEGSSFLPLFKDPDRLWKRAAFSQYPRDIPGAGDGMGYSMRTDRYRYTEWLVKETGFRARELYDHQTDPEENSNIANDPANLSLVNGLTGMLHEGWRASLPPTDSLI